MSRPNHPAECKCAYCDKTPEEIDQMHQDMILKYGWYGHWIMDDDTSPTKINYHTHNLMESYGHVDLQIVLNIPHQIAHYLLKECVDRIKEGEKFIVGQEYERIVKNYRVRFIWAWETNRPVLRMILPPKDGTLEKDKMSPDYQKQFDVSFPEYAKTIFNADND